jgi:hypothetical protein
MLTVFAIAMEFIPIVPDTSNVVLVGGKSYCKRKESTHGKYRGSDFDTGRTRHSLDKP